MSSAAITVRSLEELYQFLNKKGVMEIALRGRNSRFRQFQKVIIGQNLEKGLQSNGSLVNAVKNIGNLAGGANPVGIGTGTANLVAIGKNIQLTERCIKMLGTLTAISSVNLVLSGLNLCATCVGFAIMSKKLDNISKQINDLATTYKKATGIQADFEFNKVLSDHTAMLDARKRHKAFSQDQMRVLVDAEYNVLDMLFNMFQDGITENRQALVTSILALACMLTTSVKYFDEDYYFENKDTISDGDKWYGGHGRWMTVFDRLTSTDFIEEIQDFGIFDLHHNTIENDIYFNLLFEDVFAAKSSIQDNQKLIEALDSREMFNQYNELTAAEMKEQLETALTESELYVQSEEMRNAFAVVGLC